MLRAALLALVFGCGGSVAYPPCDDAGAPDAPPAFEDRVGDEVRHQPARPAATPDWSGANAPGGLNGMGPSPEAQ